MTRSGTKRKTIAALPFHSSRGFALDAPKSPALPRPPPSLAIAATGFVLRSPPEVAQRLAAELGFARLSPVPRPELFLGGSSFREARSFGPPRGLPAPTRPPSPVTFLFLFFSS